jgi:P-type Ca2+ transporter type 2C
MQRPPFQPSESIFARGLGGYIIRIGLVFGIVTIGLMKWAFVGEASPIGESNS